MTDDLDSISGWGYRVVFKDDEYGNRVCGIHEAYYKGGELMPYMVTVNPVRIIADTLEELKADLEHMLRSFTLPVVDYRDIERTRGTP